MQQDRRQSRSRESTSIHGFNQLPAGEKTPTKPNLELLRDWTAIQSEIPRPTTVVAWSAREGSRASGRKGQALQGNRGRRLAPSRAGYRDAEQSFTAYKLLIPDVVDGRLEAVPRGEE